MKRGLMHITKSDIAIIVYLFACTVFASSYFYIYIGGLPLLSPLRVAFLFFAIVNLMSDRIVRQPQKYMYILLLLLLICIINFIRAFDYGNHAYSIRIICDSYVLPILTGMIIRNRIENRKRPFNCQYMSVITIINMTIIIVSLIEIARHVDIFPYNEIRVQSGLYRINGTFNSSEELAIFCTVMNYIILILHKRNWTFYFLIALNLFIIFNTGFRTAFVANIFIFFIVPFLINRASIKYVISVAACATVIVAIIALLFINEEIISDRLLDSYSFITRIENYKLACSFLKTKPLFGFGIGNYESMILYYNINLRLFQSVYIPLTIHNVFLSLMLENGTCFAILVLVCIYFSLNICKSNRPQKILIIIFASFGLLFNISVLSPLMCSLPLFLYLLISDVGKERDIKRLEKYRT